MKLWTWVTGVSATVCAAEATRLSGVGVNHRYLDTSARRNPWNWRRSATPNHATKGRLPVRLQSWTNRGATCSRPLHYRPNWMLGSCHTANRSSRSARSKMRICVCGDRTWCRSCKCTRLLSCQAVRFWIKKHSHFMRILNRIHSRGHFYLRISRSKYSLMIAIVLKLNQEMR